jgi:hypothetical protein
VGVLSVIGSIVGDVAEQVGCYIQNDAYVVIDSRIVVGQRINVQSRVYIANHGPIVEVVAFSIDHCIVGGVRPRQLFFNGAAAGEGQHRK